MSEINIKLELPIGTEFWIMRNNHPEMGLVSGCEVIITSYTDINRSWHEQLFERLKNLTHKKDYKFSFRYKAKLRFSIYNYDIQKRKDGFYLEDRKLYFSIEDLKKSL